jgi:hypothetical protein
MLQQFTGTSAQGDDNEREIREVVRADQPEANEG